MKNLCKLLLALLVFTASICAPLGLASAASSSHAATPTAEIAAPKICALIIGDPAVKTKDFMERTEKYLNEDLDMNKYQKVAIGTDIQSLYQQYWFEKGFLEEQPLTKEDLTAFVKFSGYDRCLFLIMPDPSMEKTKVASAWYGFSENNRASIELNAFLVDQEKVLKIINITKDSSSSASELSAKRGAYTKCIKEIAKKLVPQMFH